MLLSNPYVIGICLDFSKAFDTVRHSTLMEKMATLEIPDTAYNWRADGDLTTATPGNKLCKFVFSTYLVLPAMNVNTRAIELERDVVQEK